MNFTTIQSEVGAQLRFDKSVAANATLIKRWINRAQQHMASRHDWSWLQKREIVQTKADKTQDSPASSSVAVSVGGTTVTGTSTNFAATDEGRFIQFEGSEDWYKITDVAGTTSLTIEAAYNGTTALSGADYTIRSFFYSLSSNVDRIVSVKQAQTPIQLGSMSPITLDRWVPFYSATGNPHLYACWGLDGEGGLSDAIVQASSGTTYKIDVVEVADEAGVTSPVLRASTYSGATSTGGGNWVIQFYPWASSAINMEVNFYRAIADLSDDSDTGVIPAKLRDTVLVEGALAYGKKYLNHDDATKQMNLFENMIEAAVIKDGQNRGAFTVLETIDSGPREPSLIQYPSQYPYAED